jgi:hypothetical protein
VIVLKWIYDYVSGETLQNTVNPEPNADTGVNDYKPSHESSSSTKTDSKMTQNPLVKGKSSGAPAGPAGPAGPATGAPSGPATGATASRSRYKEIFGDIPPGTTDATGADAAAPPPAAATATATATPPPPTPAAATATATATGADAAPPPPPPPAPATATATDAP